MLALQFVFVWLIVTPDLFTPGSGQYLTRKPTVFVTSNDTEQEFDEFALLHDGSRFFKLSEYVLYGIDDISTFFIVYIDTKEVISMSISLTIEDVRNGTVNQNLMKELFFAHYNASGVFPQMVISNTTTSQILTFKTLERPQTVYLDDGEEEYPPALPVISYKVEYPKEYETFEITAPFDLLVEVPGYSNSITARRTLVDVQSFTLFRYQLTSDNLVTYGAITQDTEALYPTFLADKLIWDKLESSIKIIPTPCIQDYFLLYLKVGKNQEFTKTHGHRPMYTYIQIPAYYTPGNDGCWINVTSVYCPNLDYDEECGEPEDIVLTNRHLLILSSKGLFVSNDLTDSIYKLSDRYSAAPLARYDVVDPCQGITECFQTMSNPTEENLIYRRSIRYTPYCDTQQYPNNDDIVIFILEHTAQTAYRNRPQNSTKVGPAKTYTVTFGSKPYTTWRPLFIRQEFFEDRYIQDILGIVYNVHFARFDITMKLSPPLETKNREDTHGKYVRFVLPYPTEEPYLSQGYPNLNGTWGIKQGFIVQNFSETFKITGVAVNPGTMDIMFYGSEIHIAESGRPLVYQAVGGFVDPSNTVTGCHFNHPDRFYVCMLSKKKSILIGRVATFYGPVEVELKELTQIQGLIRGIFGLSTTPDDPGSASLKTEAQKEILEYIFERAIFTASFSGKIYMWYFSDPMYFYSKTLQHYEECQNASVTCSEEEMEFSTRNFSEFYPFKDVRDRDSELQCSEKSCYIIPCILPLSLDPLMFKVKNTPTNGPLVPFFIDAETVTLYEGFVPGVSDDMVRYLTPVFTGQKIFCSSSAAQQKRFGSEGSNPSETEEDAPQPCELYFRHIKMLVKPSGKPESSLLPGFRSAIYATIVKAMPMKAIKDNLRVQMGANSNHVRIMCTDFEFVTTMACEDINEDNIGVSIYIPGEYSILILGKDWQIDNALKGIATHKTVLATEVNVSSYEAFKVQLSTEVFVKNVAKLVDNSPHINTDDEFGCNKNPPAACKDTPSNSTATINEDDLANDWEIGDGGCHFEMSLVANSYLKSSGGKIDIDLQDSISFQVVMQPLTSLRKVSVWLNAVGKIMLYRPLLVVTQSNPDVLHVASKFVRGAEKQSLHILLKPTGARQGVSSFVVRSQVSSISCNSPSSFTFIVQCVTARGRRLQVEYPVQVSESALLEPGIPIISDTSKELYKVLPVNYRPPSGRGEKIPLTKYVYNTDPSQPLHNSWYEKSKNTAEYGKCFMQSSRKNCACTNSDKLSDDPIHSDCKEKVFVATREDFISIKISYPPRMRDEEQIQEFFSPVPEIEVAIEEINGREDFTIDGRLVFMEGSYNPMNTKIMSDIVAKIVRKLLKVLVDYKDGDETSFASSINEDEDLSLGDKYFLGKSMKVKLHGTGLYHFKARLGKFHSFTEVRGYFILYSDTNELDDVMLVAIVIFTMTCCFVLVFFGFLRVRHRLVAHLPIRVEPLKPKMA